MIFRYFQQTCRRKSYLYRPT